MSTQSTDIYLATDEAMTDGKRAEFLRRAYGMFPRLAGAKAADILAILSDNDWECGAIEATYETHAESFTGLDVQRVFVALRVARVIGCDPRQTVYDLARS